MKNKLLLVDMEFTLILYILLSAGIGIGGTMYLVQSDRTLGAFLYFVGAVLILTFYGLRWFTGDNLRTTRYSSKTWPPVINTCPDFMSLYEEGEGQAKTKTCIDLIGITKGGKQTKFNLHMDKQGKTRIDALCNECKALGVTWEGVYDGISCVASVVPNPKGGSDSAENASC